MQVPIYKVHSLQVSNQFHTMKVLQLNNTTPAVQFNKSVQLLDSEGCKFFTALLLKWCYVSLLLKANTFHFSRSFSSHNTNNLMEFVVSSFIDTFPSHLKAVVDVLLGISPASNCSWPTFRNTVSVPSSKAGCRL